MLQVVPAFVAVGTRSADQEDGLGDLDYFAIVLGFLAGYAQDSLDGAFPLLVLFIGSTADGPEVLFDVSDGDTETSQVGQVALCDGLDVVDLQGA